MSSSRRSTRRAVEHVAEHVAERGERRGERHSDELPDSSPSDAPLTRSEWIWLGLIVVVGVGLRLAWPSQLAVEHFDEGVYSSNLWFSEPGESGYPLRHLYAPPLLPWLIEWSLVFTGISRLGPFVPSLLAGCALPPSVWWIARRWFGREAGLAAGMLAALSDFHATLSRMALTDALLALALTWSAYGAAAWLSRGGGRNLAIAVGSGAVAWWTKYNGWLPLAIAASGLTGGWLAEWWFARVRLKASGAAADSASTTSADRAIAPTLGGTRRLDAIPRDSGALARLAALIALTCLAWSPVWFDLQSAGGYGPVAANHGRYVTGLAGWPFALRIQLENLRLLECGATSLLGPALALLAPATLVAFDRRATRRHDPRVEGSSGSAPRFPWRFTLFGALSWVGSTLLAGPVAPLALLSLAVALWALFVNPTNSERGRLSTWLWLAWFVGLTVATPLYHPYSRLTLPWLVAAWMGAGWCVGRCLGEREAHGTIELEGNQRFERFFKWQRWGLAGSAWGASVLVAVGIAALLGLPRGGGGWPSAWESHREYRRAAEEIVRAAQGESTRDSAVFLVYGEPALVYELRAIGAGLVAPVGDLESARSIARRGGPPMWLVLGPHAEHDDAAQRWLSDHRDVARSIPIVCSRFTRLDRHSPADVAARAPSQEERVTIAPLPRD